ncbi:MAG: MFS transporter [Pseudomonadota bacterium]
MSSQGFTTAQRWVLGLAAGSSFIAALDGMVVTTAFEAMRQDLGAPISLLHWTMTGYSLAFAALLMAGAALGDRFGRRRMFIAGLLLFALTSAACALAPTAQWLIAARVVQGAASALVMPLAMALLGAAVTPAQRPRALGLFTAITGLAVLSGPVIGGVLVDGLGWRWVFWVNVPLCTAAAWLAARRMPASAGSPVPLDFAGTLLLTLATGTLVWGVSQGPALGWASTAVAGAIALAVVAFAAFLAWQHRSPHALVPPRLLHSWAFLRGNLVCLLMYMSLMGTLLFMAQFFQAVHHASPSGAGWRLLPWTATLFFVAPFAGTLAGRIGERLPTVIGLLLQAVGLVWMSTLAPSVHEPSAWIGPMLLAGASLSLAMPAVQSAVLGSVAPPDMGKAAGVFNTMRQLGWAFGAAAAVVVFASGGDTATPAAFAGGFSRVLVLTAVLSAAAGLVSLGFQRRPAPAAPQASGPVGSMITGATLPGTKSPAQSK